ncbi:Protein of unknown function [Pyronema omphalodes CBS 100304]|uniref:Uncharacterized protein n=1 Tax=Pyronema omphalodes (strain CBS 100304) TaxID=1076935 RepID=U4KXA5_PYROM|nr:Protein of unknown function [Pyronema omphalodes CBS 100304]
MSSQPQTPTALAQTNRNVPAITPPPAYKTYPSTPTSSPPGYTSSPTPAYPGPGLGFNPLPASNPTHLPQQLVASENPSVAWIFREIRVKEKMKYCEDRAAGKACAGLNLSENAEEWMERLIRESGAPEPYAGQFEDDVDPMKLLRSFVELAGPGMCEPPGESK